jgi:hypothetical protein
MEAEPMDVAVRETKAALAGVEDALRGAPVPAQLLLMPLAVVGDALRLGLEVPKAVSQWMETLSVAEMEAALQALIAEARTWSLPEVSGAHAADDTTLALVIRQRDQSDSVRRAVDRALSQRGASPGETGELAALAVLAALADVLRAIDERLAVLLSRADVACMLGTRAAIGPVWADGFVGGAGESDEPEA